MVRELTIKLSEEAYIAAMAISEIKGKTIHEYFEQKVHDDELVDL